MNETRREYIKRVNLVVDFIERNLDENLSLESLSEKAHFSPFHFHRVFSTVVEERLNEFINRKRIERIASILLIDQKTPLVDLAYRYGFNSATSFSRAFKKHFGISPTSFKSEGKELLSKIGIEPFSCEKYLCSIDNLQQWNKMNAQITVQELPEMKLACISHIGDIDKMGASFQRLMEWGSRKNVLDTENFKAVTIYHDNPNVTQSSKLRFSACVTIDQDIQAKGEIRQLTLPKGNYAVGHFEVKPEEIARAWKGMSVWIIENGLEFRDGDYFEAYLNDHQTHPEQKFILDICIPIQKTGNLNLGKTVQVDFPYDKEQPRKKGSPLSYHDLINYMKELRAFFYNAYETQFKLGNIYKGSPEYSYFSLTTEELKKLKLKFVIVLNHKTLSFSICLSGQNKSIRRKYWEAFRGSDWNKYHLVESIDDSLFILDHIMVADPDFNNRKKLTEMIEKESFLFINDFREILEP